MDRTAYNNILREFLAMSDMDVIEESEQVKLNPEDLEFTTNITSDLEKQARVLDKESGLMAGEMKDVTGAYVINREDGVQELVGALWTEWEEQADWRNMAPEPKYTEGFDVFTSDIAVFKKYRNNGIGNALVKKSHAQFIKQASRYNNPRAVIEITSDSMQNARKKLGYEIVDQDASGVKMIWEPKKDKK